MQILVDADACPVVSIVERVAKEHNLPVTLLCDTNHVLSWKKCVCDSSIWEMVYQ